MHVFVERLSDGHFGGSRLVEMYPPRYWNFDVFDAIDKLAQIADCLRCISTVAKCHGIWDSRTSS